MNKNSNYKPTLTLRLNEDTHAKVKYIAELEYRSLNNQIEFIIQKYIKDFEKENGLVPVPEEK